MSKISKNSRIKLITLDGKRHVRTAKRIVRIGQDNRTFVIDETGHVGSVGFSPGEGSVVHSIDTAKDLRLFVGELFSHIADLNSKIKDEERLDNLENEISRLKDIEIPSRKARVLALLEESREARVALKAINKEILQKKRLIESAELVAASLNKLIFSSRNLDDLNR